MRYGEVEEVEEVEEVQLQVSLCEPDQPTYSLVYSSRVAIATRYKMLRHELIHH